MKRRRVRRYRNIKRNSGVKFLGFIGIMISAVICGYLTARFVVAPLLGYETEVLKLDFPSKLTSLTDEEQVQTNEKQDETEAYDCYALQFGVFSTKSGATQLVADLSKKNIKSQVKEVDGQYKVLSDYFDTKDAALKELEALKDKEKIDVFITAVEE